MVTLSNTHTSTYNTAPTTQDTTTHQMQGVLRGWSDMLIAAGYTLEISCDSTQVKTDGTNTWSADSKIVWAAGGSAHSYQVFKSPSAMIGTSSNQIRIAIQCSTGAGNPHLVNFGWASAAYTSSGSVNTDPTAPTNNRAFSNLQLVASTVANVHYHSDYVSSGTEVGSSNFLVSKDGSAVYQFGFKSEATHGYSTSDTWPWWGYVKYDTTNRGSFTESNFTNTNATEVYTDATILSTGSMVISTRDPGTTQAFNSYTSSGSSIDGKFPDFPMTIWSTVSAKLAFRGYVVDAAWSNGGGSSVNQATLEPSSGTVTTSLIGDTWLAGNAVSSP